MRQQYSFVRLVLSSLLSFAAILLFGCGGGHPYTGGSIIITADQASVSAGSTTQLHATQSNVIGITTDISSSVTWASSAPSVASVSPSGLLTGVAAGTTTITATYSTVSGTLSVVIGVPSIASLAVTPANANVFTGGTQQFAATATYADNSTGDVSSSTAWSVQPASVATIHAGGLLSAVAPGAFVVTATNGSKTASISGSVSNPITTSPIVTLISIAVTPTSSHLAAGTSEQLTLTGTYSDGSMQNLSSAAIWTSAATATATVSSTGLVVGTAPGMVNVTAQLGSMQSSAVVVVSVAALQSVALSPSGASFAHGNAQQFTLTGTFTDGTTQNLSTQASWSSSNAGVASVTNTGLVTGTGAGTAMITASFNGQTAKTSAQITPASLVSVAITPATANFAKGTTQQFHATGTYSDGSTRDVTSAANFASSDAAVVGVTSSGLAMGMGVGSAQIDVTIGNQTGSTQSVTVTPATLVGIAIYPNSVSFANGTTEQFTAVATFSDGTTQDMTRQVVWVSTNPQAIGIDANGLASSGGTGTAQITATLNGITASTGTVTVTPATLAGIAITPTVVQIAKGTTQPFTATGTYTDGTIQNVTSLVTWTSSNAAAASISATGVATGNGVGAAQVGASFQGRTANASALTVSNAALLLVTFNPAAPSVAAGTSTQVAVIGNFSDGTTQDLTSSATFASSNPAAATVSNTGSITGVAPGVSLVTVTADGKIASFLVTVTNATLVSIAIAPSSPPAFAKGTTEQFTATGSYSDGSTQNLTTQVSWSSSNTGVVTIDHNGLATGSGVGSTTLTASFQGQSVTTASFQVTPAPVASIVVSPANQSLASGATLQYTATSVSTDGSTVDVTGAVTWSSSNTNIAQIGAGGLALAGASGTATISAQLGATSGSTTLTITPATLGSISIAPAVASVAKGNTQQFMATGIYSDGSHQDLTNVVTWTSTFASVATISNGGLATGIHGGMTVIRATLGGQTASVAMTVSPATMVSLAVTPAAVSLANGTSQQYTAVGTMTDGSTQNFTDSVTWGSSNGSIASIDLLGFATAHSLGTTTITATAGSITANAALNVTSATPTSVQLAPAVILLPAGGTQQMLATASFSDGTSQNVTTSVAYSSSNHAVTTVDASGQLTATGAGVSTVTATLGSISATAAATITTASLSSIAVTPANPNLAAGESQQLTAIGTYTDGSKQDLTHSVLWTSTNPLVAAVGLTGNVTAVLTGSATMNASFLAMNGSTSITVSSAVVTSIVVTPAAVTLAAGQTRQFAATATLSDLTQQDVTGSASWSVSDPSKGTVTGSGGFLTAAAAGSIQVTATLNTTSGSATVTIQPATLSSLTIVPSPLSLPVGTTQQLAVTGHYTDGSTADLTVSATYASSQSSAAAVNATGMVHGVSAGAATVTATVNGVSQHVSVTVTDAVLSSIAITPNAPSMPAGVQQQLTAIGTYTDGSTVDITTHVQWSSSSASVATVDGAGLIRSLTAGSSTLTATFQGISQTASLTVTQAVLQSIAVTASQSSFALGLSLQLTATGTYSDGSTRDLTATTTWSLQSPSVGVVSSAGLANGVTTGSFNAQATSNGVTGTLSVTVLNAVLQSIVVTPASSLILNILGSHVQYTATGYFSDGSTQNITTTVHWSLTSGLALGSISSSGSFSPLALGVGTITATSGSISGSTGFTVVSVL